MSFKPDLNTYTKDGAEAAKIIVDSHSQCHMDDVVLQADDARLYKDYLATPFTEISNGDTPSADNGYQFAVSLDDVIGEGVGSCFCFASILNYWTAIIVDLANPFITGLWGKVGADINTLRIYYLNNIGGRSTLPLATLNGALGDTFYVTITFSATGVLRCRIWTSSTRTSGLVYDQSSATLAVGISMRYHYPMVSDSGGAGTGAALTIGDIVFKDRVSPNASALGGLGMGLASTNAIMGEE